MNASQWLTLIVFYLIFGICLSQMIFSGDARTGQGWATILAWPVFVMAYAVIIVILVCVDVEYSLKTKGIGTIWRAFLRAGDRLAGIPKEDG